MTRNPARCKDTKQNKSKMANNKTKSNEKQTQNTNEKQKNR